MELNMLHRAQTFHQSYKGEEFHFHQTIFSLRVWKNTLRARLEMYILHNNYHVQNFLTPHHNLNSCTSTT